MAPRFLVVGAEGYDVSYAINPWMDPDAWARDGAALRPRALDASRALVAALRSRGAEVEVMPGVAGAPDLVFPANAAVVCDGVAVLARFLHPQRRVEEPHFARRIADLARREVISAWATLPGDLVQEGAGDFIVDARRGFAWCGHGQRSSRAGNEAVASFLEVAARHLRLASPRFYHLDTCFCPLPGGEVLFHPQAFEADALSAIRREVDRADAIEADAEDAAGFCVNAVAFDRTVVMAEPPARLRAVLEERGYEVIGLDLSPFVLSGGGAYCMTLRLDRSIREEGA